MSRQTLLTILVLVIVTGACIALAMVSPAAARLLSQVLRVITLIGRAFG